MQHLVIATAATICSIFYMIGDAYLMYKKPERRNVGTLYCYATYVLFILAAWVR